MKSKYEQFAELLENRIDSGEYGPGDYFPGERVLADDHGVSRTTVRNAVRLLRGKGLVQPVNGKGLLVSRPGMCATKPKSMLIGGVFPRERRAWTSSVEMISAGVGDVLEPHGYHLVYASSNDRVREELTQINAVMSKNMDGLIVMPAYRSMESPNRFDDLGNRERIKALRDGGTPVVLVDRSYGKPGIPCVCNDDVAGGRMATDYLIQRGCRKIIFFGQTLYRVGECRHQGYLEAMAEHGLPPASRLLNNYRAGVLDHSETMHGEVAALLEGLDGTEGIVTMGRAARTIAAHVATGGGKLKRPHWIGYDVPPDDSIPDAVKFPWLRRPLYEIGRKAAEKTLGLIDGDESAATEEFIAPEIIDDENSTETRKENHG